MRFLIAVVGLMIFSFSGFAQKEKGKIINAPKIPQNKKNASNNTPEAKNTLNNELDFIYEDEPKLKFSNQYENTNTSIGDKLDVSKKEDIKIEPLRNVNPTVSDDTSSIDEGELLVVEIEEQAQFKGAENMNKIATYYEVWDTKSLNPYGINPKELNEIVPIKLYDETEGRNWAPVLDKTVLTSHFGWRWRRWHKGTDLDLVTGDPIYAPFDGIVRVAGVHSGYGRTLILRHYNGLETLYGHLSSINYEPNTIVKAGEEIARGGNTGRSSGSHLHYETRYEGNQFDPENIYNFKVNPMQLRSQEFVISSKLYDYLRGGSSRAPSISENTPSNLDEAGTSESEEEDAEEEEIPVKVIKRAWYQVRSGDTLIEISHKFKISVQDLCKLNNINPRKKLYIGLKLRVK